MEEASTPADRFRIAMDLFETGFDLMRQNLKREHPDESEAQIEDERHLRSLFEDFLREDR